MLSSSCEVLVGAHAVHLRRLLLLARQKYSKFKSIGALGQCKNLPFEVVITLLGRVERVDYGSDSYLKVARQIR